MRPRPPTPSRSIEIKPTPVQPPHLGQTEAAHHFLVIAMLQTKQVLYAQRIWPPLSSYNHVNLDFSQVQPCPQPSNPLRPILSLTRSPPT